MSESSQDYYQHNSKEVSGTMKNSSVPERTSAEVPQRRLIKPDINLLCGFDKV